MTQTTRRARVVHAIPGRLRIRFEDDGPSSTDDGLAEARAAPGILAIETKPAARSIVVQYDPEQTTQALVLAELDRAGIQTIAPDAVDASAGATSPPGPASGSEAAGGSATRDARGRFQRTRGDRQPGPSDGQPTEPAPDSTDAKAASSGQRSEWMEMLIGPPPKLDRRFAESLALSAVSLLAARRVGLALGGGTTLPAYFAIWFALRRLTGLGRRR